MMATGHLRIKLLCDFFVLTLAAREGPIQSRQSLNQLSYTSSSNTTFGSPFFSLGFPTDNNGCFPNIISNTVPANMLRKLGSYYEYRSRYVAAQSYNSMFTNVLVDPGLIYAPSTTIPAVHAIQYYTFLTLLNGPQCHVYYQDLISRNDGVYYFTSFSDDYSPANPLAQVLYYLYNDNDSENGFEILYECDAQNYKTGICEATDIYVSTRKNPRLMTTQEMQAIDAIADRVLAPYCFSTKDLQRVIFRDDLRDCNQPAPDNFIALVQGFNISLPRRD